MSERLGRFLRKDQEQHAGTKEMRDQVMIIAGTEAENATLKASHDEQAATITGLEAGNAVLEGEIETLKPLE